MKQATVASIVEVIKSARKRHRQVCLFIGAGVSKSAGMSLSGELIAKIRKEFPTAYGVACQETGSPLHGVPSYMQCMGALTEGQRNSLIREEVESAKINWAHMAIAQLVAHGFVDRILTTNFDPLASRACAFINKFPAVYDFAGLQLNDNKAINFAPASIEGAAIYHLHGQHTGFALLNTEAKLVLQAERLEPILKSAFDGRVVIFCGYSGENDPLVQRIAAAQPFQEGLFWVCHAEDDPCSIVCNEILRIDDAKIVRSQPADRFFVELARGLDAFPPDILARPFDHLLTQIDTLAKDGAADAAVAGGLIAAARHRIERARDAEKSLKSALVESLTDLLAKGAFAEAEKQFEESSKSDRSDEAELLGAWAFTNSGDVLDSTAQTKSGVEADALFAAAGEKYERALAIKPDMYEALYNWGTALDAQARTKSSEEADALFAAAGEKYERALAIKPDKHEALYNWGTALATQAQTKSSEEADALFAAAGEKYERALAIKPDKHEALNNWGLALATQARTKSGDAADALFAAAGEKFERALAIKPDKHEALNNWGTALASQAQTKSGDDADALFAAAGEKYREVERLKPGHASYNLACIASLKGDRALSLENLRASRSAGCLPSRDHILNDRDLDPVRDTPEFQAFLQETFGET